MREFFSRPRRGRRLATIALLICQFVSLAAPSTALAAPPAEAPGAPAGSYRVVIDAGHGGSDPGTISPFRALQEKSVALRMALLTGAALQRRGVAVAYTRTDDRDVPLAARAALAGGSGAQALVSFHLNSAPSPDVGGAEAWYGAAAGGADLAATLLAGLADPLRAGGIRMRGTRDGSELAVLRTAVPSALVELGYVTNPAEAAALSRDAVIGAAAEAAAGGIVTFLQGHRPQQRGALSLASLAGMYFVQPGDTIQAIASRLGLPVEALARLNPPNILQMLMPGQPLQLPAAAAQSSSDAVSSPAGSPAAPPRQVTVTVASNKAAAAAGPGAATYIVRAGDTLSEIALRLGRPVGELARVNAISDPSLVLAGQTLRLPDGGSASPVKGNGAASGRRYTVQPGDTLSDLALRLGVTTQALAQANGVSDPDRLLAGTVLVVPAA